MFTVDVRVIMSHNFNRGLLVEKPENNHANVIKLLKEKGRKTKKKINK